MNEALLYLICYFLIGILVAIFCVWYEKKNRYHDLDAAEAAHVILAWPVLLLIWAVLFLGQQVINLGNKL